MRVADLRQHLADLARLLDAAGGKTVAKDLAAFGEALAPYAEQSPADFTRFLAVAHEYHTTGKLSAPPKPARTAASRQPKAKADPAEVAAAVRHVYDRAADLSLTLQQIEAELARLGGLTKPGLLQVCEAMELGGMKSRSVGDIRAAIRQKILDRRSAAQRAAMIHEPATIP